MKVWAIVFSLSVVFIMFGGLPYLTGGAIIKIAPFLHIDKLIMFLLCHEDYVQITHREWWAIGMLVWLWVYLEILVVWQRKL